MTVVSFLPASRNHISGDTVNELCLRIVPIVSLAFRLVGNIRHQGMYLRAENAPDVRAWRQKLGGEREVADTKGVSEVGESAVEDRETLLQGFGSGLPPSMASPDVENASKYVKMAL